MNWKKRIGWICGVIGLLSLLVVLGIIVEGGRWSMTLSAKNPIPRIIVGVLGLLVAYFLVRDRKVTAFEVGKVLGRLTLLGLSVGICWFAGEKLLRRHLNQQHQSGTIEDLADYQNGKSIPIRSGQPLAEIAQISLNKKMIYELQPNLQTNFGENLLLTNVEGMRERRDFAIPKPEAVFRVVGIGDSGWFGWGLAQEEDVLAVLESRLNQQNEGVRYEVLNLCVPGYNSRQELEMLKERGLKYAPDVVLVSWSRNDFNLPAFIQPQREFNDPEVSYLYQLIFERDEFNKQTEVNLRDVNALNKKYIDPDMLKQAGDEGVVAAFQELVELGRDHHFRMLVVGAMDARAEAAMNSAGVSYINLESAIERGAYPEEWYIHAIHPRARGHAVIAEYLEHELLRRDWLKFQE